ncbi:hypothetical protein [uncultured Tenacibaculum sp.]|uniref:alpha/beta hydrolase family protein n=1 Tax=uncultured Tenacibaculum sp. TaxID=174713 RepID=UPI0026047CB5|nr:hypothetical protein [uncultured Tenacibaculum sp.]
MQNFELILFITVFSYLISHRIINEKVKKAGIIITLCIILILHLILEGSRWQMFPMYLLWGISLLTAIKQTEKKPHIVIRTLKVIGILLLSGISFFLPSLLPVFKLPETTGSFSVGTQDLFLKTNRDEVITSIKQDKRELMIKVWYPSNDKEGVKDQYIDKAGRYGFAQKYGLPNTTFNYLDKIKTHVLRDATIPKQLFPVLIFSHGYNSKANSYYSLLSEIASHGYIIFAINHTYESTGATFPDGSLKYFNYTYAQEIESGSWDIMKPSIDAFKSNTSFNERHPIIKKSLTSYFVKDIIKRWADDIGNVVDELENYNSNGFFKNKLNLQQIGVFGHSRGGAAAGEALLINKKIKAGSNIDGVQWGQIVDTAFQKPFLFLASDWPESHPKFNDHAYINKSTATFYKGIIKESGHSNFMDIPLMIPISSVNEAGKIDPNLALKITNELVISFFDKYLKNENLTLQSKHNALELKTHTGN